ncbi:MAG: hypothetical protein U1F05_15950 [Burkholderiales bacterium]
MVSVPAHIEAELREVFGAALESVWWGISCTVSYALNMKAASLESPTAANIRYALLHFAKEAERGGAEAAKRLLSAKAGLLYVALATRLPQPEKRIDGELDLLISHARTRADELKQHTGRPRNRPLAVIATGMAQALTKVGFGPTSTRDGALDRTIRAAMELARVTASESAIHTAAMEAVRAGKQKRARLPTFQT